MSVAWVVLARLAWREGRGARTRLLLLVLGVAVGVTSVVAVGALGAGLREALYLESRRLLGADVVVTGRVAIPDELRAAIEAKPGYRTSAIAELPTVVAAAPRGDNTPPSRLVELKVVDGNYPLRGDLVLDPPRPIGELLAGGGAVVAKELAASLGLALGEGLDVGSARVELRGFVLSEPDRTNFALSAGPRVFVDHDSFEASGLVQFGSRVERKLLVALPDEQGAEDARAAAAELRARAQEQDGLRVSSWVDSQRSLRRGIERVESFLALAALLSLVLGSLASALAARSWLESRVDSIALAKCLGLERRHVLISAAGQVVLLALLGAIVGAAVGTVLVRVALESFRDLLPGDLVVPLVQWQPLVFGLALGVGSALVAALGPLLAAVRVSPLMALRRESAPLVAPRALTILASGAALAALFGAAWVQSSSLELAALFSGGLILCTLALAGLSKLVLLFARRVPAGVLPAPLRWGLASLTRPRNPARGALLALGVGVFAVGSLALVERRLARELGQALPEDAPSAFLLDVQKDQWPELEAQLSELGADRARSSPMVVARLREIDGTDVRDLLEQRRNRSGGEGGARWVLRREQRMTFGPTLPDDNEVLRGELWSDPARSEVSVEEGYAEDLGVDVGSTLVVDVQGVPIELFVSSIRSVRWESLGINFFLHVEPGVLDDAPQVRLATARLPAGREGEVRDELRARFPNVTLIDIGEIRDKLVALFGRLSKGVEAVGLLCLLAGVVVLAAALVAAGRERRREAGLLRALGAGRWQTLVSLASEYALLGAVAGLVGGAGATALAWSLLHVVLELDGTPPLSAMFLFALLLGSLAAAAGMFAARRAMGRPLADVLRAD